MMDRCSLRATLLALLSLTVLAFGNDHGAMFRFDGALNVDRLVGEESRAGGDSVLFTSAESAPLDHAVDRILLNGTLGDPAMAVEIRYRDGAEEWSAWMATTGRVFPDGRFWARFDLPAGVTGQIQFRLIDRGLSGAARVEIYAVEGVNRKAAHEHHDPMPDGEDATGFEEGIYRVLVDSIPRPVTITRAQWGANPPIGNYIPHTPYRMTQHHTAGRRVQTLQEGIAEMQFIQDFHQNGRGWQDIGYHFLIDDAGRIYDGVPPDYRGTHVGNNNTGNVGISYMGNLELPGEYPTPAALDSVTTMWSWLAWHYTMTPDLLFGHRDYNSTDCPGSNLYVRLPDLRTGVRARIGFGRPYVANPVPQPLSDEVDRNAVIEMEIRDDAEGVDLNSIELRVNGDLVTPTVTAVGNGARVQFPPPVPYPSSQNVSVSVRATDLALPPNEMVYNYSFQIQLAALYVEMENGRGLRNGQIDIAGTWADDASDVALPGLTDGQRILALDLDGSHTARVYPAVSDPGDYRILIGADNAYIGESARYRFVSEDGRSHPLFPEYNSRFQDQWGELAPTPIFLDADGDTAGYIEVSGLDGLPTRLMVDAFRLEKVDALDNPTIPILKSVRVLDPAARQVEVAWYPNLEGDIAGYRLYRSADGLTWDTPLVDEGTLGPDVTRHVLTESAGATHAYYRIVAVDTNLVIDDGGDPEPLLSGPSDAYGASWQTRENTRILIVDNFDRRASWSLPQHPFVANHGDAVAAHEYGFDSVTETAVQNGDVVLDDYDIVIYFCGDDSRVDESLAAADQWRLLAYLENGGKLFMSGSEIGYDFDASPGSEQARYTNLLKATYQGDLAGSFRVVGEAGTAFDGVDIRYGELTGDNLYIEDYPDYLQPAGGSAVALFYGNLRIAGVQYTGTIGGGSEIAQVVYTGFPFETIHTAAMRTRLMGSVLAFFGLPTAIEPLSDGHGTVREFELAQNYPNPFNPTTTITYAVPSGTGREPVSLVVFNALGERVRTLVDQPQAPGRYRVTWDGRDGNGRAVATGIFFYRLEAGGQQATRKMLMVK